MNKSAKQIEYDYIIKHAERKKRPKVTKWFYEYCLKYRLLCERVSS